MRPPVPPTGPEKSAGAVRLGYAGAEFADAFLHYGHLEHQHPATHHGLRLAIGAVAAAHAVHSFTEDGLEARLEGLASVGLGVASISGAVPGCAVLIVAGQGLRGVAETVLGIEQLSHSHDKMEVWHGALNCAKGVTTFLPLIDHQAAGPVALLHMGIMTANLALDSARI